MSPPLDKQTIGIVFCLFNVFDMTKMSVTDKALLSACRQGDESAWELLVSRYQRLIYSIARRAGLDEFLSAEVFQNVFLSVIENIDKIEQPDRLQAWIVTATRRETWRQIHRQKEHVSTTLSHEGDEEQIFDLPDSAPLPEAVLLQMEEQQNIHRAVLRMDERCRQLLEMLFYRSEPPPYAEVATALGLPEGSIGPTRARCLQKLLRLIEKSDF
jgi:RNA polymerase sigma factor (sigma-70 family)